MKGIDTPLHIHGRILPKDLEADIYIVEGHITFQKPKVAKTVVKNGYILPGLVDMHAHLSISSPAPEEASLKQSVRASAKAHLKGGVLTIREPGSPDYASLEILPEEGLPRIKTAGRFLAPHGRYFPGLAREVNDDQRPQAAQEEAKKSGDWAKVGLAKRKKPNKNTSAKTSFFTKQSYSSKQILIKCKCKI